MGLEKNLSLLVIMEVDNWSHSKEISSLIYDIEEDPYNFKKYVLTYTREQYTLLQAYIDLLEGDIIPGLNSVVNNSVVFSKFKNNEETEEVLIYDLVSKLFIKIPFLNLENNQQTMNKLYDEIIVGIANEDKSLWENLLMLKENSGNDPSIEEIIKQIGVDTIE